MTIVFFKYINLDYIARSPPPLLQATASCQLPQLLGYRRVRDRRRGYHTLFFYQALAGIVGSTWGYEWGWQKELCQLTMNIFRYHSLVEIATDAFDCYQKATGGRCSR